MIEKSFVAFIPVRGGSKSIPLKNIKPICGRPLVHWTLDAAINCDKIQKVYLCTDSEAIADSVEEYRAVCRHPEKLFCIERPDETATDTASTESAMLYFAENYTAFSHIVLIQATSPLLSSADLENAIAQYEQDGNDSMLSVVNQKRFIWDRTAEGCKPVNYDFQNRPRRQEFDGFMVENGAFYITPRRLLLESRCRLSGKIGAYMMPEVNYFEIDEPSDWVIIEQLLLKRKADNLPVNLRSIKMLLTDCDGVMTDAGMYYSEKGDELKKFNAKDGMGIQILREKGILFGIITGENSELVKRRAQKLQACECALGVKDKLSVLYEIARKYNLSCDEIAYIGDDINDVALMKHIGYACCPADAIPAVKDAAKYISSVRGGSGVLRDVAEKILEQK